MTEEGRYQRKKFLRQMTDEERRTYRKIIEEQAAESNLDGRPKLYDDLLLDKLYEMHPDRRYSDYVHKAPKR
jgi:hypothetical protein